MSLRLDCRKTNTYSMLMPCIGRFVEIKNTTLEIRQNNTVKGTNPLTLSSANSRRDGELLRMTNRIIPRREVIDLKNNRIASDQKTGHHDFLHTRQL